jgi:hypothetical protein
LRRLAKKSGDARIVLAVLDRSDDPASGTSGEFVGGSLDTVFEMIGDEATRSSKGALPEKHALSVH